MGARLRQRWQWAAAAIVALAALVLLAMGRNPICACGRIALWGAVGPTQSQMLADWYSPSHLIHGLLFYALGWWLWRHRPVSHRFLAALALEAMWEVAENTPFVIDRYREATASLGYVGDSVLNSMSDIAMMAVGFWLARRLPPWASIALAVGLELLTLAVIRDNLTLNVLMLLWPVDAIRQWQAGA